MILIWNALIQSAGNIANISTPASNVETPNSPNAQFHAAPLYVHNRCRADVSYIEEFYISIRAFVNQATDKYDVCPTAVEPCWNDNEEFFSFTRGRFLRDEARELSQRYVKFNVGELARLASQVAGTGSCHCVKVDKLTDGMYNKALLFTMDNGIQVVGKIPNPNAGRPHLTTASEVATMDFMRNVIGTPVPKVLTWSSRSDNAVGAEYIIMEKLQGVQLSEIWDQLEGGYLFLLGDGAVAWKSKRQASTALSTTEAEYIALAEAVKELLLNSQHKCKFCVCTTIQVIAT